MRVARNMKEGATVSVIAVIQRRGRRSHSTSTHVLAGQITGKPLVNLQKPWRAIRKRAGLDDVRLHDLRHSFASMGVAVGGSLPVIGRVLGHSQPQTTARYAHVADKLASDLVEAAGAQIAEAMKSRP